MDSNPKRRKLGRFQKNKNNDPLFNTKISKDILIKILKYFSLFDLVTKLSIVNKKWNNFIFNCRKLWELVCISYLPKDTNFSPSSSIEWLKRSKINLYIKDLNIECILNYDNIKILAELHFPVLREFSIDINKNDDLVLIYLYRFLNNHQHIIWINEEFLSQDNSRKALISLETLKNLKCLGVERLYISRLFPLSTYPNLESIGHIRIQDDDEYLLTNLNKSLPNLKCLSICINNISKNIVDGILNFSKLNILYILINNDDTEFVSNNWLLLKKLLNLKKLLIGNISNSIYAKIDKLFDKIVIEQVNDGLNFWTETEKIINY